MKPYWIDSGQPDAAAHSRVGARAPDLTVDILILGEVDQILDYEEIAGEPELLDYVQFVLETAMCCRVDPVIGSRVYVTGTLPGEMTQVVHLIPEVTGHREVG